MIFYLADVVSYNIDPMEIFLYEYGILIIFVAAVLIIGLCIWLIARAIQKSKNEKQTVKACESTYTDASMSADMNADKIQTKNE